LARPELRKQLPRGVDLSLLSSWLGVLAVVVPAKQQHIPLGCADRVGLPAKHTSDFVGIMAHAEFMETVPQRLQPLNADQVDPAISENQSNRSVNRRKLEVREILDELFERN
jgi:hypothetical protein